MKNDDVTNIGTDTFRKKYMISNTECTVEIEDAFYGDYKGTRELLDEKIVFNMCKDISQAIAKNISKYNQIPSYVKISHAMNSSDRPNVSELYSLSNPEIMLEEIALDSETYNQIELVLSAIKNRNVLLDEWGIKGNGLENRAIALNFYGYPGTGKTMTAGAIARFLGKKMIHVNYSELESKYVGDTPKNIKKVFEDARCLDAVLVFDEADSFLSKRLTNITQAADYGVNITRSTMLVELEKFDGVVVFTTNLISNYDSAFKRRIFANIEFKKPDAVAREKIWSFHLGERVPLQDGLAVKGLAEKYEDVTGADIKDMVLYAGLLALKDKHTCIEWGDFDMAFDYVMKRYEQEEQ